MTKKNKCVVIFSFFVLMLSLSSCHSTSTANKYDEVPMNNYYKIEDFQSITIGESTYKDVYEIASTETIQITSYGGFCEYPMQNGGYICVKFYGRELVVGDVEEIPENAQGTVSAKHT